jgi:H+/gluconate symporter-like permease
MPAEARATIERAGPLSVDEQVEVVRGMNKMLADRDFYDYPSFVGVALSEETRGMLGQNRVRMPLAQVERLNRLLLEDAFDSIAPHQWETARRRAANLGELPGNPNFALLLSVIAAMAVFVVQQRPTRHRVATMVESALMSGGVIILITAAGGAFGAMLGQAQIGPAIQGLFASESGMGGIALLILAFSMASMMKFAQGSGTVAMITAAGMMAAMIDAETLGYHPVYLACAVGSGSLVCTWMNDSGYWIYCKMGGLTEAEALKSWTPLLAACGIGSMIATVIGALVFPMPIQ